MVDFLFLFLAMQKFLFFKFLCRHCDHYFFIFQPYKSPSLLQCLKGFSAASNREGMCVCACACTCSGTVASTRLAMVHTQPWSPHNSASRICSPLHRAAGLFHGNRGSFWRCSPAIHRLDPESETGLSLSHCLGQDQESPGHARLTLPAPAQPPQRTDRSVTK
jgi:hypothetical protein